MARGGDGYTVFAGAKNLIDPIDAQLMASQVIDYIAAEGTVRPKVEGRIKASEAPERGMQSGVLAVLSLPFGAVSRGLHRPGCAQISP